MSVNRVILLGRVGQDPELKNLPSGGSVATLSLATSERYTNKQGEKVEDTTWHRLEVWGKLAEVFSQHVKKGNQLYVEGQIKVDKYQDKEGNSREISKVRVTTFSFVGGNNQPTAQENNVPQSDDSDLPF